MSELAHLQPQDAPAPHHPLWMPTDEQLLARPVEYGIAIDPPGSHEIDDAIYAEPIEGEKNLFAYKVHIADGGLLAGTEHIDIARERGWTRYRGVGWTEPMLPREVTDLLSLDREAGEAGQPAITVSFVAGEGVAPTDFTIHKSRLICRAMTYQKFARKVRLHHHSGNTKEFTEEDAIFRASLYLTKAKKYRDRHRAVTEAQEGERIIFRESQACDMNALYMLVANIGMARMSLDEGLPYVFRNQHFEHFDHPLGNTIRELYPDSKLFEEKRVAWYSRIPTKHAGMKLEVFGHSTSPLRRSPDLFNHVNRSAALDGEEPPFNEEYLDEFVRELAAKIKERRHLGATALSA